jgi:hypothetical protein
MSLPFGNPDTTFDSFLQALPADYRELAMEFEAFTRSRKIKTPAQLLQVVMSYCGLDAVLRETAGQFTLLEERLTENPFDELKNHWGWGGFTTHDLKRCRFMARLTALTYNGWSLFARLADPHQHTEAITSRPLLLHAPARLTRHGGQTRITISHPHAEAAWVERTCREIAAFFKTLRQTAEQLTPLQRGCRVLSRALVKYLNGRQLHPPLGLPTPA